MALIICPECGKTISDKAKFCVHCGYPIEDAENTASTPAEDSVMSDWKCPLCGVTNAGSSPTCKVCGFNKPEHELKVEAAAKRKQIPSSVSPDLPDMRFKLYATTSFPPVFPLFSRIQANYQKHTS